MSALRIEEPDMEAKIRSPLVTSRTQLHSVTNSREEVTSDFLYMVIRKSIGLVAIGRFQNGVMRKTLTLSLNRSVQ